MEEIVKTVRLPKLLDERLSNYMKERGLATTASAIRELIETALDSYSEREYKITSLSGLYQNNLLLREILLQLIGNDQEHLNSIIEQKRQAARSLAEETIC